MRWATVILICCAFTRALAEPPKCPATPPDLHADLRADLTALADPQLDGRAPGTTGDTAARALVVDRFTCLGLTTLVQPFDNTANVVGILPGKSPETIVIGAHLDHLGDGHLGANDDASGIAGLLAVAARATAAAAKPDRTLVFVAFGAEELGEHGSAHFAAHPPQGVDLAQIVYDVNLDMLGTYASHRGVVALGDFPTQPARKLLDALVQRARPALNVVPGGRGVGSDHEAFCKHGIPYIFFWTPDDRCYHQKCDTVRNIDWAHLAQIATLAADLVLALADATHPLADARGKRDCAGAIVRQR